MQDPASMPSPLLSIIVPLFNHVACSKAMVASLRSTLPTGIPYELILVDDGSTDETRKWLKTFSAPGTKVLLNEKNLGFAGSNNRGAAQASGEFLALLNNDLILKPGWLEPMLEVLQAPERNAGIVGNVQLRLSDGTIDHAGIAITRLAKLEHIRTTPSKKNTVVESLAVTAACCLLRKADFLEVGGFDEAYINGAEDVDLVFKLRERGKRCYVALNSTVLHQVSASRGPTSLQDERNSRRLYQRWPKVLGDAIAMEWTIRILVSDTSFRDRIAALLFLRGILRKPPQKVRFLTESALWREEARWRSLLDSPPQDPNPVAIKITGLKFSAAGSPPFLGKIARVRLLAGLPKRNLFICGHVAPGDTEAPCTQNPIGLRVTINGIQTVSWFPLGEGEFNLGIDAPASLPNRTTRITFELLGQKWPTLNLVLAWLLSPLPLRNAFGRDLQATRKRRFNKRLRLTRIVCDDQCVVDLASTQVR